MKTAWVMVLAAALAAGCASSSERGRGESALSPYEGYIGAPIRGFTALTQQSWQAVSRTQLILWTSTSKAYLITVMGTCPDLMFENEISVTSTTNEISTFESVIVGRDRCRIEKIQPIDVRQKRADDKELKDNPQPAKPDPAP